MNRTEYLLDCAAEECAEVAQRCMKANRFGLSEIQPGQPLTNAERIMGEYLDLQAVIKILQDEGALPKATKDLELATSLAKYEKIEKFMELSRKQGTLQ